MITTSSNEIKQVFEQNVGLKIREESLSEYLKTDKYLEDISVINDILGEKSSNVDISNYKELLNTTVEDIVSVYAEVFESSFEAERAVGVIDAFNMYTVKNNQIVIEAVRDANDNILSSMHKYTLCIFAQNLGFAGSNSFYYDTAELNNGISYFPKLILRFVMGCSKPNLSNPESYIKHPECSGSWKNYSKKLVVPYLTKILEKTITECVERGMKPFMILDTIKVVAEALKTCCVILKYNERIAIKLRGYIPTLNEDDFQTFTEETSLRLSSKKVDKSINEKSGVFTVTFVRDAKKYSSLPLFAYQALDAAIANDRLPSWNDLIIGRYARNDKMFREDFGAGDLKDRVIAHVVAGSRAGKGVMCLNILASILGSGLPVFYADSKPDMSLTLKTVSSRAVVIDAGSDEVVSGVWNYLKGTEAYSLFKDNYYLYGGLMYLRLIQLALIIAEVRMHVTQNGDIPTLSREDLGWNRSKDNGGGWDDLIVFLDEFERAMSNVVSALNLFQPKKYKLFELSSKDQLKAYEETGTLRKYIENAPNYVNFGSCLGTWVDDLAEYVKSASKASLTKGKVRYFLIYQAYESDMSDQCSVFKAFKEVENKMCFIGNNTNFFSDTSLGMKMFNEDGYLQNRLREKCFVFTIDKPVTLRAMNRAKACVEAGTTTVFKSYLLLNDSNINSDCAKEFFSNIPADFKTEFANLDADGSPISWKDKRVGFKDYIDSMLSLQNNGANAENIMAIGRDIADKVVRVIGYTDYIDFITDLNASSMVNTEDLVNAVKKGINIKKNGASQQILQPQNLSTGAVTFEDSNTPIPNVSPIANSQGNNQNVNATEPIRVAQPNFTNSSRRDYYRQQREVQPQPVQQNNDREELIEFLTKFWNDLEEKHPKLKVKYDEERKTRIIKTVVDNFLAKREGR